MRDVHAREGRFEGGVDNRFLGSWCEEKRFFGHVGVGGGGLQDFIASRLQEFFVERAEARSVDDSGVSFLNLGVSVGLLGHVSRVGDSRGTQDIFCDNMKGVVRGPALRTPENRCF